MRAYLDDLRNRVRLMVGRAVISAVYDDGAIQTMRGQLLAGETQDDMERVQQYGFTARPHGGAEGVVVFPGGSRDHGLVIAVEDRRYRLRGLQAGEVALYDDLERKVLMGREGIVVEGKDHPVTVKSTVKVRLEAPMLECTGDIKDRCDTNGMTMAAMRAIYNEHDHIQTPNAPKPTPLMQ